MGTVKYNRIACLAAILGVTAAAGVVMLDPNTTKVEDNVQTPAIVLEPARSSAEINAEKKALFREAARKRFHITKSDVLPMVEPADRPEVEDVIAREAMLSKLISEALDHRPELLEEAKAKVLERHPRILRLSQQKDGETYEQSFIVSDTLQCTEKYEEAPTGEISLNTIFDRYCVDRNFDYPGGFNADNPIKLSTLPVEDVRKIGGLDNDFDKLIMVELRGLIIADFADLYENTGKLTYVP